MSLLDVSTTGTSRKTSLPAPTMQNLSVFPFRLASVDIAVSLLALSWLQMTSGAVAVGLSPPRHCGCAGGSGAGGGPEARWSENSGGAAAGLWRSWSDSCDPQRKAEGWDGRTGWTPACVHRNMQDYNQQHTWAEITLTGSHDLQGRGNPRSKVKS